MISLKELPPSHRLTTRTKFSLRPAWWTNSNLSPFPGLRCVDVERGPPGCHRGLSASAAPEIDFPERRSTEELISRVRVIISAYPSRKCMALPNSSAAARNTTGTDIRRDLPYDFSLRASSLPNSASAGRTIISTKVIHHRYSGILQYDSCRDRLLDQIITANHRTIATMTLYFADV